MAAIWKLDKPKNEMDRILTYAPGTPGREQLSHQLDILKHHTEDIPLVIGGREVQSGELYEVRCPHDHQRVLARAQLATEQGIKWAIDAALNAQHAWAALDWYQRAAIFLRAADLLAGPRHIEHIAAIMVNQSKTPFEAEIDLAELVDFWRFNAYYMQLLYEQQPDQAPGEINRFDWRPLEGFVLAIPPFNFYSIGGNLATAPAMVGNVVLWKPARSVLLTNYRIMQLLQEAGLPAGVINFLPFDGQYSDLMLGHPAFAGLHFTGSYETLVHLWRRIGERLPHYRNFPRIVGETGGKDFICAHLSADVDVLATNVIRGAFEYQGQKCSAASRLYVPATLWEPLKVRLLTELPKVKVGPVEDLNIAVGALIGEEAYKKVVSYLEYARQHPEAYDIIIGGDSDHAHGWFVTPTVIVAQDPHGKLMTEEIFGPVLTVYVYQDADYEEMLRLCEGSTPYGLTGAIIARDRHAIAQAESILRYAAGNFYINDKPTGAVVARQPFGGARHSGTNDKAGSWLNMTRWLSPRTMKETLVPARDWRRPYLGS
jgi:1-pyrroline-5-carboxylate dehydrogenase